MPRAVRIAGRVETSCSALGLCMNLAALYPIPVCDAHHVHHIHLVQVMPVALLIPIRLEIVQLSS